MGADETVNYHDTPDWDDAVLDLTKAEGIDQVAEVGGPSSLQKSVAATRRSGHIGVIGSL
jgi:NADPH:quinone reductase-like Zn-dependent oxidoreductase